MEMTRFYYKYISPAPGGINIDEKYFLFYAFHRIKEELGVVYKFGTDELIPMYCFRPVSPSEISKRHNYHFSHTLPVDGRFDPVRQAVEINPFNSWPRLLEVIAHEVCHIRQHHTLYNSLVKNGISLDELNKTLNNAPEREEHTEGEDYKVYRNKSSEIEAREFARTYKDWRTAIRYYDESQRSEFRELLNGYIIKSHTPLRSI